MATEDTYLNTSYSDAQSRNVNTGRDAQVYKDLDLFFSKKFTIPSTNGFSGPITISSILSLNISSFNFSKLLKSILMLSANKLVPPFPGKQ